MQKQQADNKIRWKITSKIVIKVTGNVKRLLKGLSVADDPDEKNAFINSFGKIIVLFDQIIIDDTLYLAINKQFETRLKEHLDKYLRLNKSIMEKLDLKVIHIIECPVEDHDKIKGIKIKQKKGNLILVKNIPEKLLSTPELDDESYNAIRIENNMSEQGIDFDQEMILNTNWKDLVSYTKGCYLGQEVMARVKNLGKSPKKMIRVLFDKLPENNAIMSEGKIIGNITSYAYSKKYDKYIAFCMVKNEDSEIDNCEILK